MGTAMHFRCRGSLGGCRQRPMWQETARRNLRGATGCVCFFFSKIGKHVSLEFTVVIIPHCFCSFLKGGRDSLLM